MERSGNPVLDIHVESFVRRLIIKLKEKNSTHGEKSVTVHNNLPSDAGSFREFVQHLRQEIGELCVELVKTYPDAVKIREELIDVAAMCILVDWYMSEGIDTNCLDVLLAELQPEPRPVPNPPKECPTPDKDCPERGECYFYKCDTCGLEEQFEEHSDDTMECPFCRNGSLIYKGLMCEIDWKELK